MNYRKIWRKIDRPMEDWDFSLSDAWPVRKAIAESLVVFFEKLKKLDVPVEDDKVKDADQERS